MELSTGTTEVLIFIAAFIILAGIMASRISDRLGVPALLLFLMIGMLVGSEGPGGINFDDPEIAGFIGVIALVIILFAGGLDTNWQSVRPVVWQGVGLSTIGVLMTGLLMGWFVSIVTPLSLIEGLLIGSIVSSTDAAAVFAVLRSRNVRLRGNLKPLLELESGSNDPMAVLLTIGFIGLIQNPSSSIISLLPMFFQQMALGALLGYIEGRAIVYIVNHLRLGYEGLYPVLSLALLMLSFSATAFIGGNGYLAVYIAGIIMGNSEFVHKRSLVRFHDGLAWLMQITMFVTLGLLVFPSELVPVAGVGFLVAAFLIVVARPVSVFVTLAFAAISTREKALVSWVGLRGAVPVILGTFPLLAGVERADVFFNLVFFIVLTSASLQGSTIPIVAKWLRVDAPPGQDTEPANNLRERESLINRLTEVRVPVGSKVAGKQIVEARLPANASILLINHDRHILTPTGSTVLEPGDVLLVLASDETLNRLVDVLEEGTSGISEDYIKRSHKLRTSPAAVTEIVEGSELKNLIVGIDFSPRSFAAAQIAVSIAQRTQATVELVHVVETRISDSDAAALGKNRGELVDLLTQEARAGLETIADQLAYDKVRLIVLSGNPAVRLAEHYATHSANLLVVGDTGAGSAASPKGVGSTAYQLVERGPHNVLVVKVSYTGRIKTVAAAISFVPVAREVMLYAHQLARVMGAELHVVRAIPDIAELRHRMSVLPTDTERVLSESVEYNEKRLNEFVAQHNIHDVVVKTATLTGQAGRALVNYVRNEDIDLVVIGTGSSYRIAGYPIGSATHKVVNETLSSVFVIRHPEGAELHEG